MPNPVAEKPQVGVGTGDLGERPSLEWLIRPVGSEAFFRDYWEQEPLLVKRNQSNYFVSLLSLDDVDRVITTLDRRYPDVILKNANGKVSAGDYVVRGNCLDVAKVYQLFEGGATITLAYLDTVIPSLAYFCRSLEDEFSCPFQTNVYLTPPNAQGAKPHYDTHDVFVLQVTGSKRWTVYGTPVELPLAGQDFDASIHGLGDVTLEFELNAGDIAYIPRGVAHAARSGESVSLHITAGVLSYTWADLLLECVADISLRDPAFRKTLPPGFARTEFCRENAREIFQALLSRIPATSNFEVILDRFVDQFVCACPPVLQGQMRQLTSLDRLASYSQVGARAGVVSHIRTDGESMVVECYGRRITFPVRVSEAVRFALGTSAFVVRDLPGDLDDTGKLTLVRRLIREGLVVALKTSV